MKNRLTRLIADTPDRIGTLLRPKHSRHAENSMIFRIRTILFRISFGVLTLGIPWCTGALFHAFDIPVFVSWCGVFLLAASLIAGLFFRRALLGTALIEVLLLVVFCLITPEQRFRGTVWQSPWRYTLEVRKLENGSYELRNVRDFLYRSENDFDVRYRTVTVTPEEISSIDAVFSPRHCCDR